MPQSERMSLLSARDLAADIRSGRTTPEAALEQVAAAIAAHESEVGGFVTLDLDSARTAARAPGLVCRKRPCYRS